MLINKVIYSRLYNSNSIRVKERTNYATVGNYKIAFENLFVKVEHLTD